MRSRKIIIMALTGAMALGGGLALAQAPERSQERAFTRSQEQEQIFGSQLMTPEERAEYRARMRAATNAEEREQIRSEHHARMQQRAAEQGVTLPGEPPMRGGGMMRREEMGAPGGGMGPGTGRGMGPGDTGAGGGMGPGGGGMGGRGR